MKPYSIQLEIAGDTAMWTRPDTGDCPVDDVKMINKSVFPEAIYRCVTEWYVR